MKNGVEVESRNSRAEGTEARWELSFEDAEVELINTDMEKEVCEKVLRIILRTLVSQREVLANCDLEGETKALMAVAKAVKSNLGVAVRRENPWQVIIGRSYGTFVTHEARFFLFFKFAGLWITIFVSS